MHGFKNKEGLTTQKGVNPIPLYTDAKTYDPLIIDPYSTPYKCVSDNINKWIEYAANKVER